MRVRTKAGASKTMPVKIVFAILFLAFTGHLSAQQHTADATHQHDPADHEHDHHRNEVGIALAPVYFTNEEQFSFSLHLHYLRNLGESGFGLGLGYERIFDEHGHNTISLVGSYRPGEKLTFILSPGILFEDENPGDLVFAIHTEVSYEFAPGNLHIGPLFEVAVDPEDVHLSMGLHIGIGF